MNCLYNEGKDLMPITIQRFLDHCEFAELLKRMKYQNKNRTMQLIGSKDYISWQVKHLILGNISTLPNQIKCMIFQKKDLEVNDESNVNCEYLIHLDS